MKKILSTLDGIYNRCINYLFYLAEVLIFIMMLVIVTDVTIRYTVKGSVTWGFEFTEYALVYITFLGVAWLLRSGGHVKMDILLVSLKNPASKAYLNFIASILLIIACILLLWFGASSTIDNIQNNVMSVKFYSVPKFIFVIIIPISSFLLLIQALKLLVESYRSLKPPRN